jgi:putative colanic acid biosynthesis acetyltransferase WcaF
VSSREFLWHAFGIPLFRLSFHNWYALRRSILRLFGAEVSASSRLRPSAIITHPWNFSIGRESAVGDRALVDSTERVTIGDFCTVSQHAKLLTALAGAPPLPGLPQRAPIVLQDDAWVAADAMVLPGVTIKQGAILGARGCARESLAPWTIFGGDPLRPLGPRTPPPGANGLPVA